MFDFTQDVLEMADRVTHEIDKPKDFQESKRRNTMYAIADVLVQRDGYTREEAEERVAQARREWQENPTDPEEFLLEEFGLEPDYFEDLLSGPTLADLRNTSNEELEAAGSIMDKLVKTQTEEAND